MVTAQCFGLPHYHFYVSNKDAVTVSALSSLPSQYGALSSRNSLVSGFVTLIQLLYERGNINIFSKYKTNVPNYMVLEVHWDTIIAISRACRNSRVPNHAPYLEEH